MDTHSFGAEIRMGANTAQLVDGVMVVKPKPRPQRYHLQMRAETGEKIDATAESIPDLDHVRVQFEPFGYRLVMLVPVELAA